MNDITPAADTLFPSTPEEFEEYSQVMNSDPDYLDNAPDDSYLDREDNYSYEQEDQEDRYLDSSWEDQSEYGMEGCCGDF